MLVATLSAVVLTSAIVAGVYILNNKTAPPDTTVTFFSSSLAALVGLFVQGPTDK